MAFARELVRICEVMKASRRGCPTTSGQIPFGVNTIAALPGKTDDCFASAAMMEVYNYLRGGKDLRIPDQWRAVLPAGFVGF